MTFPVTRMRRLRANPQLRAMVREVRLTPADVVMPLFVVPGTNVKNPITSMPGQFQFSTDLAIEETKKIRDLGIPGVLLFAIPEHKDDIGSASWDDNGIIQRTVRSIKEQVPGITVITDLCFCEYTSHGHCGVMHGDHLDNDATLENLVKQTISHAKSGADMIAPSGMIDGGVAAIRAGLDQANFSDISIMAYSAKFASSFYGPFRDAVDCAPSFGDRKTYQMDPANIDEAMREVALDVA
ncbi:MAG: porphobilinogen synthase, partial [Chlamydiia bacterium]|nr:porphobilinogen synthase [Chlamydiia bacterium]